MTKDQMQQVLDALNKNLQSLVSGVTYNMTTEAIAIMQAAVDAPEVEPAYWFNHNATWIDAFADANDYPNGVDGWDVPLYLAAGAAPQERKPLTDKQIRSAYESVYVARGVMGHGSFSFARAVEAAHGIKGATE